MNVGFYIEEMNYRGVANSTYSYALNNSKILKNKLELFSLKNNFKPGKPLLLHDEPIFKNDEIIGYTTSSNFSFCYKKNICLAYVNSEINDNQDFFIEVEGKKYPLYLEKKPLHDPTSKMMRS